MLGSLASRSADTLASAAGIGPLMCAMRASSAAKLVALAGLGFQEHEYPQGHGHRTVSFQR